MTSLPWWMYSEKYEVINWSLKGFWTMLHNLWFLKMGWTEANSYIPLRWLIRWLINTAIVSTTKYNLVLLWSHEVIFHTAAAGRLFLEGRYMFTSVACLSKAFMFLILLVLQDMLDPVWRITTRFVTAWVISLATKISILYNNLRL